jgi:hypothetical protein
MSSLPIDYPPSRSNPCQADPWCEKERRPYPDAPYCDDHRTPERLAHWDDTGLVVNRMGDWQAAADRLDRDAREGLAWRSA